MQKKGRQGERVTEERETRREGERKKGRVEESGDRDREGEGEREKKKKTFCGSKPALMKCWLKQRT